jgi:hypothetical protein
MDHAWRRIWIDAGSSVAYVGEKEFTGLPVVA